MAKIIIGNVKGKDGRGITEIVKTASTESVDTYTITYTDNTTSTFTVNNSNSISLQRQIVPSAAVESSTTASQAYTAGDYVVVGGVLRKVTSSITKGSTIGDSNSAATTVTGEIATVRDSVSPTDVVCLQGSIASGTYCAYQRVGHLVYVFMNDMATGGVKGVLPEECRPQSDVTGFGYVRGTSSIGQILINSAGEVSTWCNQKNSRYFAGSVCFVAK